jgi:hypothetical protein
MILPLPDSHNGYPLHTQQEQTPNSGTKKALTWQLCQNLVRIRPNFTICLVTSLSLFQMSLQHGTPKRNETNTSRSFLNHTFLYCLTIVKTLATASQLVFWLPTGWRTSLLAMVVIPPSGLDLKGVTRTLKLSGKV